GLAEREVVEADVDERLQPRADFPELREIDECIGNRRLEHVGDRLRLAPAERDLHVEHLGAIALTVALRATQIYVAQELHLDVLEAVARAHGATAVARVEAERAGRVLALPRERLGCEELADRLEHTDE